MNQAIDPTSAAGMGRSNQPRIVNRLHISRWGLAVLFAMMVMCETRNVAAGDYAATEASAGDQFEQRRRRAGCPDLVARCASSTYGRCYCGLYVGGGAATIRRLSFHAEPPYRDEGTFGMDYSPPWSCVNLMWYHGRKYQGGEGQYQPTRCNNPFPNCCRR
jgi:hypothetical protein